MEGGKWERNRAPSLFPIVRISHSLFGEHGAREVGAMRAGVTGKQIPELDPWVFALTDGSNSKQHEIVSSQEFSANTFPADTSAK